MHFNADQYICPAGTGSESVYFKLRGTFDDLCEFFKYNCYFVANDILQCDQMRIFFGNEL